MSDPSSDARNIVARHLSVVPDPPAGAFGAETEADPFASLTPGGDWVLDIPADAPAVWGAGDEILWAQGEALMIAGQQGAGKTTIAHQLIRGRIGLDSHVLGFPVEPGDAKVLYLAMDRPSQAARAMRRLTDPGDRATLNERLTVWAGPPPADIARHPDLLVQLAEAADADTIVLDSLKDAIIKPTDDEVGGAYNRARQKCLVNGVELLELHHQRKAGAAGGKPDSLADIYGSVWLTSGAGSVLMLSAEPGDMVVEVRHVKQPSADVGPLRIIHDHATGRSRVDVGVDLVELAGRAGGITATDAACAVFETAAPTRNQVEKARYRLDKLAEAGQLRREGGQKGRGKAAQYHPAPTLRVIDGGRG